MDDEPRPERRGWDRSVLKRPVSFRVVGDPGERMGHVTDLTTRGAGFVVKGSIPVGKTVHLRLMGSGPAMKYCGVVRWTSAVGVSGDYRIGVKFVDAGPRPGAPAAAPEPAPAIKVRREEHRRFPRRAVKILSKLRCVTSGIEHEQVARGGMIVNISKSGLEIVTTRDYASGAVLEVTVSESDLGPARTLYARVAWSKPAEQPGRVHVGASFVKLSAPPPAGGI